MKLTREEAIKRHRELWGWLAENPTKNKQDWPGWKKCGKIQNDCFCCELAITCGRGDCALCPFEWPKTRKGYTLGCIPCEESYFGNWKDATAPEERSKYAALIRDLPEKVEKKGEAEFAIGDRVKVLNNGFSFSDYVDFFPQNNLERFANRYTRGSIKNGEKCQVVAIGKHSNNSYGLVYVLEKDNDIYLMHNGCKNGLPGLKLAEPPAPKFKVGDKVVPVSEPCLWISLDEYKECGSFIADFLKENEFLFIIRLYEETAVLSDSPTSHHGDTFNVADLRPYIEPKPKNLAPENKTVIEDGAKFIFNGSVTVCIIDFEGKGYKGIAKCAPDDTFSEMFGQMLAEVRAFKAAFEDAERMLLGR